MVQGHLDARLVKVTLDPVDIGVRAAPHLKAAIPEGLHHLAESRTGPERLVLGPDVLEVVLGEEPVEVLFWDAGLEENASEGGGENVEEGFVLLDLGEVGVVALGTADPSVEEELGGDTVFGELVAEAGLDGMCAIIVGD